MRSMNVLRTAVARVVVMSAVASGALAAQLPLPIPKNVHGCLRPDVAATKAAINGELSSGAPKGDLAPVQKEVAGCTAYVITFESSVYVVSNAKTGGTRKVSGKGSITFGLTGDVSEPDFDFTSGPDALTAPIFWTDPVITTGNDCIVTTVPAPFTEFTFWLGVKGGTNATVALQITPNPDLHNTATRCPKPKPLVGWVDGPPGEEAIFSPAWTALHAKIAGAKGMQATTEAIAKGDMNKAAAEAKKGQMPGMDMASLQALADKFKDNPPSAANMGDVMKTMQGIAPNSSALIAGARDNFMLKLPGACVAGTAMIVARCNISRTVEVPDNLGTTQTITENTVVTIARAVRAGSRP